MRARVLFCCQCQQRIYDMRLGNLIWPANDDGKPILTDRFYFVHKRCDHAWTQAHKECWWKWRDLEAVQLIGEPIYAVRIAHGALGGA